MHTFTEHNNNKSTSSYIKITLYLFLLFQTKLHIFSQNQHKSLLNIIVYYLKQAFSSPSLGVYNSQHTFYKPSDNKYFLLAALLGSYFHLNVGKNLQFWHFSIKFKTETRPALTESRVFQQKLADKVHFRALKSTLVIKGTDGLLGALIWGQLYLTEWLHCTVQTFHRDFSEVVSDISLVTRVQQDPNQLTFTSVASNYAHYFEISLPCEWFGFSFWHFKAAEKQKFQ